ncbi:MAG: PAS domain-containing protein [Phycisphaerales bacterium]|nr:PAS domain-containing protein [Phycisphaerales bacterium]
MSSSRLEPAWIGGAAALSACAGAGAALTIGHWSGAIPVALAFGAGLWAYCQRPARAVQDTSLNLESDQALIEARQQVSWLERVVDAVDAPVLAADAAGRVLLANEAMLGLLESDASGVLGARVDDLFTQADLIELVGRARRGVKAEARVRLTRRQRTYLYDATARHAALDQPGGVVLTLRDVTALASAVQLKTDFVGNASHELRTPIAAIRVAVDTLIGPARNDPAMRERLATMIRDHVLRLEDLIGDLLDLSRFESPEYEARLSAFDLDELCAELEASTGPLRAERRLTLTCELAAEARSLQTDRSGLLLIVRNLVDNALKFSHDGGTVRLVAEPGEPGELVIRVIDRGIGIPLSQQQRIFERFYQVDAARSGSAPRRGTGLGLAIVKHALRRLGGSIEVESVWQEGTTMTVRLPGVLNAAGEGIPESGLRSRP